MGISKDFLLGDVAAAYQVGGAWDKVSKEKNKDGDGDYYNRCKKDIGLMAKLGLESYRLSILWAKIYPDGDGEINLKGIKFYNKLINECLKCEIEPIITLYHKDLPLKFEKEGAWLNKKTSEAFVNYAKTCFEYFGDRVKKIITFNETIFFSSLEYLSGKYRSELENNIKKYFQVVHNIFYTHAKTILEYKKLNPSGEIGLSNVFSPVFDTDKNIFTANQSNIYNTHWYNDLVILGQYPNHVTKDLEKSGNLPKWTEEELDIIKKASTLNDFMGFGYYQTLQKKLRLQEKLHLIQRGTLVLIEFTKQIN